MKQNMKAVQELLAFIRKSPTAYQAVSTVAEMLEEAGYTRLEEGDSWNLIPGGKYYLTRNLSSLLAFALPEGAPDSFLIAASHSDSPTFKLKDNYLSPAFGKYVRFNTERYGGMLLSTWFDRPLSVAGRVILRQDGHFIAKSVVVDRDLCLIPNVAIHLNRDVNNGYKYNPAVDLLPLYGMADSTQTVKKEVAEAAGVAEDAVVGADLYLYDRTPGVIFGADNAFFASPRIDNLMCAYGTLRGFLDAREVQNAVKVYACFDNEETGSATKQGAASMLLRDTLSRIAESASVDLRRMLANSFMVSADNGHARHPNHPELSDGQNAPDLNGGVVIKANAAQKYTTDALSAALFSSICRSAGVPVQGYANRSDLPGGSTLGSISDVQVPLCTVDIGMAQLAMHSAYETAGCADVDYLCRAMTAFFGAVIRSGGDGRWTLSETEEEKK